MYVDTLTGVQPYVLRSFVLAGTEQLFLNGLRLERAEYAMDYRFGRLWAPKATADDTLIAHYRTWGLALKDQYDSPLVRAKVPVVDSVSGALPSAVRDSPPGGAPGTFAYGQHHTRRVGGQSP